jgi:hypothetical protein
MTSPMLAILSDCAYAQGKNSAHGRYGIPTGRANASQPVDSPGLLPGMKAASPKKAVIPAAVRFRSAF